MRGPLVVGLALVLGAWSSSCRKRQDASALAGWGDTNGACDGLPLPAGKTRNARYFQLHCASVADHYIRLPDQIDLDAWFAAKQAKDWNAMHAVGQKAPPVHWTGTIPYSTVETWTWTDWVYGPDPSCGYEKDCWTDEDGEEHCVDRMKSCYHDEDRSESRHCSTEYLDYDAQYVRPTLAEWGPGHPDYVPLLPNKYDLLPGESEDVQILTNSPGVFASDTTLAPYVAVGNAWNKYDISVTFAGGTSQMACRANNRQKINVRIATLGRVPRQTPNAFRMPVDRFGQPIEPLSNWTQANDRSGKLVRAKPIQLSLNDASDEMIRMLADSSREFEAQVIKAKMDAGKASNAKLGEQKDIMKRSFWKDTQVRVRLYLNAPFARPVRITKNLYVTGSEVARLDSYRIPLSSSDFVRDLYRKSVMNPHDGGEPIELEPGKSYTLYVAMYQKGVPFYAQDCADPENKELKPCREGKRWGEDQFFSKELPISFETNPDVDDRGTWQKFKDWQRESPFEKLGLDRLYRWMTK